MKNFLVGVMLTILGTVSAHAGEFNRTVVDASKNISNSGQKTVVMFHTDKSPKVVLSQLRNAMQVRDPNAFFYPYWVTEIYHEQTVGKNCGFIIGKWWSGSQAEGASNWEPRVYNKIENSVNLISFGYYYDDITEAKQLGDALSADGKDVINACES